MPPRLVIQPEPVPSESPQGSETVRREYNFRAIKLAAVSVACFLMMATKAIISANKKQKCQNSYFSPRRCEQEAARQYFFSTFITGIVILALVGFVRHRI